MRSRQFLAAALVAICLPLQAATEVIALQFRAAAELLSVAQSVVGDKGRVNAQGNQLIVNAAPEVIAELRQVLEQLDSAPKRLLITVDSQTTSSDHEQGYAVSGGVRGDRSGNVSPDVQARIIRHSTQGSGAGVQQIQASEGYPAFIQVGESVPLTASGTDIYGQPYQQTEYRDVMRGFYATATVHGDRVQVSISNVNDQLSVRQPGAIELQRSETRVSGRLGEWITVGSNRDSAASDARAPVRRYSTAGARDSSVRLKIDRLD
jgi:hypothetical protein